MSFCTQFLIRDCGKMVFFARNTYWFGVRNSDVWEIKWFLFYFGLPWIWREFDKKHIFKRVHFPFFVLQFSFFISLSLPFFISILQMLQIRIFRCRLKTWYHFSIMLNSIFLVLLSDLARRYFISSNGTRRSTILFAILSWSFLFLHIASKNQQTNKSR